MKELDREIEHPLPLLSICQEWIQI